MKLISDSNKEKRQELILDIILREHEVTVRSLVSKLRVSGETVRKDLLQLEEKGIILRRHGKVILVEEFGNAPIPQRAEENQAIKERIAAEVMRNIKIDENALIGLDVGSTVWNVAKLLVHDPRPVIITNSLDVSNLYSNENNPNIYCTGGMLTSHDRGFYGHWACKNLQEIHMTACVLGTPGLKGISGLGAISFNDRDVKKIFVENSEYRIAVFDSFKIQHRALVDAVDWNDIDLVITDSRATEMELQEVARHTKLVVI